MQLKKEIKKLREKTFTKDKEKGIEKNEEKAVMSFLKDDDFTLIPVTKGCAWAYESGCSMCGYVYDSMGKTVADEKIKAQVEKAFEKLKDAETKVTLKLYTSGSFFDTDEVSEKMQEWIVKKTSEEEKIKSMIVESRPEYIDEKQIKKLTQILGQQNKILEIGIGLETTNDKIRDLSINKGFTFDDFKTAVEKIKKANAYTKAYLLLKPPFLTNKQAVQDMINSIDTLLKIKNVTTIGINVAAVHRGTLIEQLWKEGKYESASLHDVVKVIKYALENKKDKTIALGLVGAGSPRGPRACKKCQAKILEALDLAIKEQDPKHLEELDCDCNQ